MRVRGAEVEIRERCTELPAGLAGTAGMQPGIVFDHMNFTGEYDLLIRHANNDCLIFEFPLVGGIEFDIGGAIFNASVDEAAAIDGDRIRRFSVAQGRKHSIVVIERDCLNRRLAQLLDAPVSRRLEFFRKVPQSKGHLPKIQALVDALARSELGGIVDTTSLMAEHLPVLIADMLLQLWPHNYSSAFAKKPLSIAPRHVKKAVDYIHAHALEHQSALFLAELSGVSLRTMQYGFKQYSGYTITEYQQRLRLQFVKKDLMLDREASINEIAHRWGFQYSGRFSQIFLAAFGELPSAFRNRSAIASLDDPFGQTNPKTP